MNNLRLAFRLLRKSPGFTALVVFTLAIGIGANTAIFSLVNGACLRALPYPSPDQLVHISERSNTFPDMSVSYPNFLDWHAAQDVFNGLALYRGDGAKLKTAQAAEQIAVLEISADFFSVVGLHSAMGRDIRPEDDHEGAAPVAWVTHAAWQRYFRGDPGLVGETMLLDGIATTIAGVLPPEFHFHRQADVFIPIDAIAGRNFMRERSSHNGSFAIGRLKPGVTLETARTQLTALERRLEEQYPKSNAGVGILMIPLRERLQGNSATGLYLLLGAVGMVLMIACVNVANMLLARSFGRAREMAIRAALGATRKDLFKQLLTESLLLSLVGGVFGLLIGQWGYELVSRLAPWEMRELMKGSSGIDYSVWIFVSGLTLITGIGFGLAPAWQLSHSNPNDALKNTRPAVRTLFGRLHLADALVLIQISLAVMLLVGAGLLIRSLQRVMAVPTGLNPEHVLTLRISTPSHSGLVENPAAFVRHHESVLEKIHTLGEVDIAAFSSSLPFTWNTSSNWIFRPDRPLPEENAYPSANSHVVTPDYFKALGIPLLQGEVFSGHEARAPLPNGNFSLDNIPKIYAGFVISTVINRKMAERYWPGEDPIGKTFIMGKPEMKLPVMKIIGVVGNTTQNGPENGEPLEFYTLLSQLPAAMSLHLVVRTHHEPKQAVAAIRTALHELLPEEPIFDVETLEDRITAFSSDRRFRMGLFLFFAGSALLLAGTGIYGVLACLVGQRTREIGIRMALGAQRTDVLRNVVGRGLTLAAPGIALGLIAAWAGGRALQSQLFGITPADIPAYLVSGVLLLLAALLACAIPARRAATINPIEALRTD